MPCEQWQDGWVAHLYDELAPPERATVEEHLRRCAECRRTMERLAASRSLLQESAPEVPPCPRVVVLENRTTWRVAWAFAAGLAAATIVFLAGTFAATGRIEQPAAERPIAEATGEVMTREQFDREIERISRRFSRERAADFEYLLRSLAASEQRTGTYIDRTQQALTYLALRDDPRVNEH